MLRPDRVVFQDVLGQTGLLQFMQTRRDQRRGADDDPLRPPDPGAHRGRRRICASRSAENKEVYDFLRSAAAKYGLGFWGPGAGIIHQVVLENYAFPGELIIGTDSHTPNAGGLGACAVGVGGADAVEVIAGLPWEVLYPRHIAVLPDRRARAGGRRPRTSSSTSRAQLTVVRRDQRDRRVHRPRRAHDQRHRQGDDHQHGRRARGDDLGVPGRRAHGARICARPAGRDWCRWSSSIPAPARARPGGRGRPREVLRSRRRARSVEARTARGRAAFARSGAADLAARRRGRRRDERLCRRTSRPR